VGRIPFARAICGRSTSGRSVGWWASLGLACTLGLPRTAPATEWKLWPIVRWASAPSAGLVRWTALGPLVEYYGRPEGWSLAIRPLVHLERRYAAPSDLRADVLFPVARLRATDEDLSLRILLFTFRSKRVVGAPAQRETAWGLYPFAFYRRNATGVSGGVLPFYLDLHDVLGYSRVRTILFPGFLELDSPQVTRRYYLFPFLSTVGGPDGEGWRLWPAYGDITIRNRDHTRFVAWPFHIRRDRRLEDGNWEHQRIDVPWYASSESPGRRTHGYGLLGLTHTIDEHAGTESIGSPWPFVLRERHLGDEEWFTWRMAPVYGRTATGGFASRFYAWPAYRWRTVTAADASFERHDVLLLLWRWQHERLPSGKEQTLHTLFPAWRAVIDDGAHRGQVPALVDSILPTNRGVLDNWAPLYALLRWDTAQTTGTRDWSLLWGLLTREQAVWHGPIDWRTEGSDGG
jgi:hypothetical protein